MPATPSTPFVDSTHKTDIKAGFSFRHVEMQVNRLMDSNRIVQIQLSQRLAPEFRGGRYEIGFGRMDFVNRSVNRYAIWGLGYSFTKDLSSGNLGFKDWRSAQQIPLYGQFGIIKSLKSKWLSFNFRPSIVYVPYAKMRRRFQMFDDTEGVSSLHHEFYSVLDLSLSIRSGPLTATLGSKFPGVTTNVLFKQLPIVEEYLYLRLTFNFTKFD